MMLWKDLPHLASYLLDKWFGKKDCNGSKF
jgi:hypothetical protein